VFEFKVLAMELQAVHGTWNCITVFAVAPYSEPNEAIYTLPVFFMIHFYIVIIYAQLIDCNWVRDLTVPMHLGLN